MVVACRDAGDGRAAPAIEGHGHRIDVFTRCDRVAPGCDFATGLATSVVDGEGIADLKAAIDAAVASLPAPVSATLRMRVAATAASTAVAQARQAVEEAIAGRGIDEAVVAGSLRTAAESLAEVTGAAIGTDLLDRIFSRHCIGK